MKNTFGSSLGKALGTKPPEMNGFDTRRARYLLFSPSFWGGADQSDTRRSRQLTHYAVVRKDLPLGVIGAQLIHAAGESSPGGIPEGTFAVCLGAQDEDQLLELERKLIASNIKHTAVREPDAPYNGALMAIGIEPVEDRTVLRPITGNLPLLR